MVVATGAMISARAVGEARLQFSTNKFPILRDVYFIPCFKRNLIYVSRLNEQLFNVSFDNEVVSISKNGLNICYGYLDNGPYFIRNIQRHPVKVHFTCRLFIYKLYNYING